MFSKTVNYKPEDVSSGLIIYYEQAFRSDPALQKLFEQAKSISDKNYVNLVDSLFAFYTQVFVGCMVAQTNNDMNKVIPYLKQVVYKLFSQIEIPYELNIQATHSDEWLKDFAFYWVGKPSGNEEKWIEHYHDILKLGPYSNETYENQILLKLLARFSINLDVYPNNVASFKPILDSISGLCKYSHLSILELYRKKSIRFDFK